jgi:hypothetical protein
MARYFTSLIQIIDLKHGCCFSQTMFLVMLNNLTISRGHFCHNSFDMINLKKNWEEILCVNFNIASMVPLFQPSYPKTFWVIQNMGLIMCHH